MCFALSDLAVPQRAALCAAPLAVGAAVSSTDADTWGVSDPLCHPPVEVLRLKRGGRSRPRCMSLPSGRTALCSCHHRARRLCRTRCPRDSGRLRARLSGFPEDCVHIGERALAPNFTPEAAPRRRLLPVFQPARLVRHVRSLAEQLQSPESGHHDARLSGGPRRRQATPLRSVPCGLAGLTAPRLRRRLGNYVMATCRSPTCSALEIERCTQHTGSQGL